MIIETMLSHKVLGSPDQNTCRKITDLIHKTTPVTVPWEINIRDLREYLDKDKKQSEGKVSYSLICGIGQPVIGQQVPFEILDELLKDEEVASLVPWLRHS
jgi:3-dehydroquinate synthetase